MGQLQWRGQQVALANTHDDGFAGEPDLVLRTLVGFFLPLGGWHQARFLTGNVDTRAHAEPEMGHGFVDALDAEQVCQGIEIHVAGSGNGIAHVRVAMAGFFPVAVTMAAARQREPPGAGPRIVRVDDTVFEPRQRHEWLDGRAGRVGAAQDTVEHGTVEAVRQCAVVVAGNTAREQVGIEARSGSQYQDIAGHRVHSHYGTAPASQGLLCHGLQFGIQCHSKVAASVGPFVLYRYLRAANALHAASFSVHQHLAVTRSAMQQVLEGRFHTHLAHYRSAGISIAVNVLHVGIGDGAHVSQCMHTQRTQRVVAG